MSERIGFVSTRFAGTDGVSLESSKWSSVLQDYNHASFWYAGRIARSPAASFCVPEAFFGHPENTWINERIWGHTSRDPLVTRRIRDLAEYLKETLREFISRFDISILIVENALSIPMHVPLGLAITELLTETVLPAIAHHHDFYWERTRFSVNAVSDLLETAFPPRDPSLQHVVINQAAQEELSWRKGVPSMLIPNVLDFEHPPPDEKNADENIPRDLGLKEGDVMILQPTRVVPRKGIEHAIKLVQMLGDPRYKLIVTHEAGDEGLEYRYMLAEMAHDAGVEMRFIATQVVDKFSHTGDHQDTQHRPRLYTLGELYRHAALVTYPSLYEGFGNAFLEAVYYRVPMLVNRYATFTRDIEPKGFHVIVMDGFLTRRVVENVRALLENESLRREMGEHNFEVASRFYSFSVLRRSLRTLITNIRGLPKM